MPAKSLEQVYQNFKNEPFETKDFDALYVNADKGRGGRPAYSRIKRYLSSDPGGSLKILFAGHRGCGKSTELLRLQRDIEKRFVVLNFSALRELDILNLNYIELFIVTMERLFDLINNNRNIKIDEMYLKNIRDWLKSRDIQEIVQKHMDTGIETGIKGNVDIPFLAKFFASFKAAAKASSSIKETLTTVIEPKISELILNCNLLIDEIKKSLPSIGKDGIIIIVEDMDKVDIRRGEDIFYIHSTQLTQLNCHCIFTFPIALLYHYRFKTISNKYDEAFVLPMIKVFEKDGSESRDGIKVMENIVGRRMDISLFEEKGILNEIIRYTGGCLWDMFRMIKDASDNALDDDRIVISRHDFDSAYKSLKAEYEYTIAENTEKQITVEQYYEALKKCALDQTKKPDSSDIMLDLRNNLTVLNYNDANWGDVHPVVKDILKEKGLLNSYEC